MSPPPVGILEGQGNISLVGSATSFNSICHNGAALKEHNYMGVTDSSLVDSSSISSLSEEKKCKLNLKATKLRLGLPGSQSPERDTELCLISPRNFDERDTELCLISPRNLDEKPLFPLLPSLDGVFPLSQKTCIAGNKRSFLDASHGFSGTKTTIFAEGNWMFPVSESKSETAQSVEGQHPVDLGMNNVLPKSSLNLGIASQPLKDQSVVETSTLKETMPSKGSKEKFHDVAEKGKYNANQPPAKAQIVGWPPVKSFRKNTSAGMKNSEEVDDKPGPGALYIKVSMDGAPYLRKVDLKTYSTYQELSSALENMFSCFTIGQCGSHGAPGKDVLSETKLRDLLHGSEYVLTYEDRDGDWMLVGDVPWEMFIGSCKRLRIMKGSDAIGLAPRAMEKSRNKN